ncbi:hypothetical protein EWB00_005042 [Schistosoma japonicum]|uniref:Uncharacterized protein n=1 Tax=Schistosoma japonicum TaxID=6182 RepID=A0A4Z2D345_SCHJA|nr:hypothetical protein KSF78_0001811 [Schistosoma japonicum]TNN10933.1 hypothetical protein EWB00_005042 [Schistosoma japonicum]
MKLVFILSLAIYLFVGQVKCHPSSTENNIFLDIIGTYGNLRNCLTKSTGLLKEYLQEDNLDVKLKDVLAISKLHC